MAWVDTFFFNIILFQAIMYILNCITWTGNCERPSTGTKNYFFSNKKKLHCRCVWVYGLFSDVNHERIGQRGDFGAIGKHETEKWSSKNRLPWIKPANCKCTQSNHIKEHFMASKREELRRFDLFWFAYGESKKRNAI